MTRAAMWMVAVLALGCATKPSTEDCRKAIANMQVLMGTENLQDAAAIEGEVRRCKGGSTKKAVDCAIKAQSLDDLRACRFYKGPDHTKGGNGSGAHPAGSAGSAAPTGSAAGSADAAGTAGSAGSAGSAADSVGSGAGSAGPAGAEGSAGSAGAAGSTGSAK